MNSVELLLSVTEDEWKQMNMPRGLFISVQNRLAQVGKVPTNSKSKYEVPSEIKIKNAAQL
jgi:hypothetical protein